MTSQGNGQPGHYNVSVSEQLKNLIRQLYQQAIQRGQRKQFVKSLRTIHDQLQNAPVQFGERLYRLPALKLVVFHAAVSPVVVTYAVHEERRLVFLRSVKVLG